MSLSKFLGVDPTAPDPGLPKFNARQLSISRESITYKGKTLTIARISGVSFGTQLEEKTVEQQELFGRRIWTFRYLQCTIKFVDAASNQIRMDIYARSEQEHRLFVSILELVYKYVIPGLVRRIAVHVNSGKTYDIGKLTLTKKGIQFKTGWIFKTDRYVPYKDMQIKHEDGTIRYSSSANPAAKGSLNGLRVWNAMLLEQIIGVIKALQEPGATIEDVMPPAVLEVRAQHAQRTLDGEAPETLTVIEIAMRGPIEVPAENHPVIYQVDLYDTSEGEAEFKPVLSTVAELQLEETIVFGYETPVTTIPYQNAVISRWMTLIGVPVDVLVFPRRGTRKLFAQVSVVCAKTGKTLTHANARIVHQNRELGYEDLAENKERTEQLTVSLAVAMSAADGVLHESEGTVVQEWIKKRVNTAPEAKKQATKNRLNEASRQAVLAVESDQGMDIKGICEELIDITPPAERYSILELCMQVTGADETAADDEMKVLDSLAEWMQVDMARFRSLLSKALPVSIHEVEDAQRLLGLRPEMTPEERRSHLRAEFRKWNARATHADPKMRQQATRMLELIAEERSRLEQYAEATATVPDVTPAEVSQQ